MPTHVSVYVAAANGHATKWFVEKQLGDGALRLAVRAAAPGRAKTVLGLATRIGAKGCLRDSIRRAGGAVAALAKLPADAIVHPASVCVFTRATAPLHRRGPAWCRFVRCVVRSASAAPGVDLTAPPWNATPADMYHVLATGAGRAPGHPECAVGIIAHVVRWLAGLPLWRRVVLKVRLLVAPPLTRWLVTRAVAEAVVRTPELRWVALLVLPRCLVVSPDQKRDAFVALDELFDAHVTDPAERARTTAWCRHVVARHMQPVGSQRWLLQHLARPPWSVPLERLMEL